MADQAPAPPPTVHRLPTMDSGHCRQRVHLAVVCHTQLTVHVRQAQKFKHVKTKIYIYIQSSPIQRKSRTQNWAKKQHFFGSIKVQSKNLFLYSVLPLYNEKAGTQLETGLRSSTFFGSITVLFKQSLTLSGTSIYVIKPM